MKIALIGQDVPTLLPAILTDLLFAGGEKDAGIRVCESNPDMRELIGGYGAAIYRQAGLKTGFYACGSREEALEGADAVIYAGDCQPASRFDMDRSALEGEGEDDPGLTDQARVNGGLGGLMHALRAGEEVLKLCGDMDRAGLNGRALVINLGQPVARTTEIFINRGYRCFGMGRPPVKGPNGLEALSKHLKARPEDVTAVMAGLPGFAFMVEMRNGSADLMPKLIRASKNGELGKLSRRWTDWWGAVPAGDVTDHAEFLQAQPDFIPEERPAFGETVERRKDRILWMNTVKEKGAGDGEGAMAQLLLLSKAQPVRPMRLALMLLRNETGSMHGVAGRNNGEIPGLPPEAVTESSIVLENGAWVRRGIALPDALLEIMARVDLANRLAAKAAEGDRAALREYIEEDPALDGLDRLYCMDVADALIRANSDVLPRWSEE